MLISSAETNSVFYERIFYWIVVYRTNEYSTILSLLISDVTKFIYLVYSYLSRVGYEKEVAKQITPQTR